MIRLFFNFGFYFGLGSFLFGVSPEEIEFFENRIRPVLAESCYECHNSVNKARAGLALDWSEALLAGSDEGAVIVPGDPGASVLIWAIRHQDGFEMPEEGPKLEDSVIADFEAWIEMGAPDPRDKKPTQLDLDNAIAWETLLEKRSQWWSFQPVKRPSIPKVKDPDWNQSDIDKFIFAGLGEQGLQAQEEASPEALVRRLHLILTGLPPKPDVTKAFLADPSQKAYEAMVDDLLASVAYGERWGRYWLDWYRFSETHGSEGDPALPHASIYRDYIIRALNEDVPYNQLLKEHIAGDLLDRPRINKELQINESAIGPAHFRMVPYGFGVVDAYQEQIVNIDNQIDVLSKAMLGVTVSCARCHNHKFDPISQKDFYRLYGILASTRPGTRNVDTDKKQNLNKRSLQRLKPKVQKAFADYWLSELDAAIEKLAAFSFEESKEDQVLIKDLQRAPRRRKKTLPTDPNALDAFSLKMEMHQVGAFHPLTPVKAWIDKSEPEFIKAWFGQIEDHQATLRSFEEAKSRASFYADLRDQATVDQWFMEGNGLSPKVSPSGSFAVAGDGHLAISGIYPRGVYSHLISDKHSGTLASPNHIADGDWGFMRAVGSNGAIRMSARNYPLEQGLHVYEYAENGAMQWFPLKKYKFWNDDLVHFQVSTSGDKPVKHTDGRSWFGVTEVIGGDVEMQELGTPLYTLLEDPSSVRSKETLLAAYREALAESLKAWRRSRISDAQAEFLGTFVRFNLLPNHVEMLPEKLRSLIEDYRELENEIPEPTRAPAQLEGEVIDQPLLKRGEYKNADEPVSRQFLEVFANRNYSAKNSGRLELADDIAGPTNTLKTRVLVNRLWSYVFGRGIVETTDNFGRLGKKPTHPELLDHLTLEFESNDWSIKTSLKAMVMSRTFRSASLAPAISLEKDPGNVYFSYFSPRRLDAEAIKDSVNFLAKEEFQRSVYQKVIRNKLDPFLATFNLPIPTTTTSKRDSTNIPAQALSMMNGDFVQTASREWSRRVNALTVGQSIGKKIDAFFWDAYARSATSEEKETLKAYYHSIDDPDTAMENIAFALLNTKELMYLY